MFIGRESDGCCEGGQLKNQLLGRCLFTRESNSETRQAFARSEAHNKVLEARIATMETQLYRLEWQRQDADDHATRAMMRIYVLEHREHIDTLKDTGSTIMYGMLSIIGYSQRMLPKRTTATTTPMTDAQIKALIAQGVADVLVEIEANRSRNGMSNRRRRMPVARECTYSGFLKCQPLNFK
ncbi:hypothetical protein Tco_0055241, partial [Tanacetum coccineum]